MVFTLYERELSVKKALDVLLEKENLLKLFKKNGIKKILKNMFEEDTCDLLKGKRKKRKTILNTLNSSKLVA